MPYTVRGKCVYKKDTGKKVGCTKGSVQKYLAALQINAEQVQYECCKESKREIIKRGISKIVKQVIREMKLNNINEFLDYDDPIVDVNQLKPGETYVSTMGSRPSEVKFLTTNKSKTGFLFKWPNGTEKMLDEDDVQNYIKKPSFNISSLRSGSRY